MRGSGGGRLRGGLAATATAIAVALLVVGATSTATAGPDGPAGGSVAVIGDFGSGDRHEREVAWLVARAGPVAVVSTGDNVYDDRGYDTLVGDYYGRWVSGEDFIPATGNHDHEQGIDAFDAYFPYLAGRHVYATGRAGIRFFVLDSTTALASPASLAGQRAWLKRSLLASPARWKVVVLHHPPYSSGEVHGSTPEVRWPFGEWGADLVLSGHEHNYERIGADGTTFVVDGSGGKDLYDLSDPVAGSRVRFDDGFGALFLWAGDRTLTGEFWSVDGVRVDRFVLRD